MEYISEGVKTPMPASSIDTFLACSLMVMLVVSAMAGMLKILYPCLYGLSFENNNENFRQLADYLLLNTGSPSRWGSLIDAVPNAFGLALANASLPYVLDVDKVSRLNSGNQHALSYAQIWQTLGMKDVSLRIGFTTLFDVSVNFVSSRTEINQTTYQFVVTTHKTGMPIHADLSYYVVARNYVKNFLSTTSRNGNCTLEIVIPNWANGTALLIMFARAKTNSKAMAFNVYAFSHLASQPEAQGTFAHISPLNYTLYAHFLYNGTEVLATQVFTYNYCFNLTKVVEEERNMQYSIPRVLDCSPMILVVYGLNGTTSFAEWVAYPQVPLVFGANFEDSSSVSLFSYVVTVNSVFYLATVECGGVN